MQFKPKEKKSAISMRTGGLSFREISEALHISKSTASVWTRNVKLSNSANKRLKNLSIIGREKGIKTNKERKFKENLEIAQRVNDYLKEIDFSKNFFRIACALLYWGEGTKYEKNNSVSFMNADPVMIKYFLFSFRKSFKINEKKLRGLIHLHEYHNENKQLKFWSKVTNIPICQFNRSYRKNNTGRCKKKNYPGCLSIRYCDSKIYKELMFIIETLTKMRA